MVFLLFQSGCSLPQPKYVSRLSRDPARKDVPGRSCRSRYSHERGHAPGPAVFGGFKRGNAGFEHGHALTVVTQV